MKNNKLPICKTCAYFEEPAVQDMRVGYKHNCIRKAYKNLVTGDPEFRSLDDILDCASERSGIGEDMCGEQGKFFQFNLNWKGNN